MRPQGAPQLNPTPSVLWSMRPVSQADRHSTPQSWNTHHDRVGVLRVRNKAVDPLIIMMTSLTMWHHERCLDGCDTSAHRGAATPIETGVGG